MPFGNPAAISGAKLVRRWSVHNGLEITGPLNSALKPPNIATIMAKNLLSRGNQRSGLFSDTPSNDRLVAEIRKALGMHQ
jgi:hypothetical protein